MEDKYLLIPEYVEGFDQRTREFSLQELQELFSMEKIQGALDQGTTVLYKGNNYYIDLL